MDIDAFLKGWYGTVVASDNSNRSFCIFRQCCFFSGVRKTGKDSATGNPLFEATAGFGCLVVHAAFLRPVRWMTCIIPLWRFRKI
jgi:hypothetical protein